MTKATDTKLRKMGVLPPEPAALPVKRNFTPQETLELQEMLRICNARRFEAAQIKGNTAIVPRGKELGEEIEAIARLMENTKNFWVSQKLLECGYEANTKCSVNLSTGEIVEDTGDNKS